MNTVIIPTFNEFENLPELVTRLRKSGYQDRILIVDDSPDNQTAQVARDLGCEVLKRVGKRGLSSAVIDGINTTNSYDKIVVMDADLQHPPEVVSRLFEQLNTHDFVVASRYIDGGGCEEWDLDRKVISRVANLAARPLTSVKDAVSGFFGFTRSGLSDTKDMKVNGFKIMLELLVRGHWDSIVEVPYTFATRKRGKSNMRWEQIRNYLFQLVTLYFYKYRLLRFMVVGGIGTFTNLLILYLLTDLGHVYYLGSFVFAFVVAASQNYWLNRVWTFIDRSETKLGYFKYMLVAATTLVLDEALLFTFTEFVGLWYMLSAIIAIMIAFIVRYIVSEKWIWRKTNVHAS